MKKRPIHISIIDAHEVMQAQLQRFIQQSFAERMTVIQHYKGHYERLDDEMNEPHIILINEEKPSSISLLKNKWPRAKVVVLSSKDDHRVYNRSFVHGADHVMVKDQWLFQKLLKVLKSYSLSEHDFSESGLLNLLERGLGLDERKRISIIESDGQQLYELHYRLSRTLDMNVDAYRDLDSFYSSFVYFPDIILLSRSVLAKDTSGGVKRMKTLSPSVRVILLSKGPFQASEVEDLLDRGVDKMIDRQPATLDSLERMILSYY